MSNYFIAVANHSQEEKSDGHEGYYNVLAGASLKGAVSKLDIEYGGYDYFDNEGENISSLNKFFCELTVVYWMYKNMNNYTHYGLVHYRRKFVDSTNNLLLVKNLDENFDIILPEPKIYFPFNVRMHYSVSHYASDLETLNSVIENKYPEYLEAYRLTLKSTSLHLYNMFIIKNELFQEYANWLFSVLDDLYVNNIHENRSAYQARVYGFLGERLLNVWLRKKLTETSSIKIKYYKVLEFNANSRLIRGVEWFLRFFKFIDKK